MINKVVYIPNKDCFGEWRIQKGLVLSYNPALYLVELNDGTRNYYSGEILFDKLEKCKSYISHKICTDLINMCNNHESIIDFKE
jgi:hypothetical protein